MLNDLLKKFILPPDLNETLKKVDIIFPESRDHILTLAMNGDDKDVFEVEYDIPGKAKVTEATVTRVKNGIVINYTEPYMRRRDPDSMLIGDSFPTDKPTFQEVVGKPFEPLRNETLKWFSEQDQLIVMPFSAGNGPLSYPALIVAPTNAGFFVGGLADLQGFIPAEEIPDHFQPQAIIYLAPTFRHTHFDGKQKVIHYRTDEVHEMFSYNLYPGPSAKKGVYGFLIDVGEKEGWLTLHCSTVKVVTPYENEFVILHEGASGGGKSEMIQEMERDPAGNAHIFENMISGEQFSIHLSDVCELHPVTDDMALTHPTLLDQKTKLKVLDAESGWFLRVDHIEKYGTMQQLEKLVIHPPKPLIFLNLESHPGATTLPWEPIEDAPGKPCPNPRIVMPRKFIDNRIDESVEVDARTFGVRTPMSTREKPNYGIIGIMHILPPALAWLWRLVAPRGHANPSIISSQGMPSEGVGSYWPFATGKMIPQANLLLDQIVNTPDTKYNLIPNQFIGAYKVGFMGEWITREYLSRRGNARFKPEQTEQARCSLLGFALNSMKVEGIQIPRGLLKVNEQIEVGNDGYDAGAKILQDFFKTELKKYYTPELSFLGRRIVEVCMDEGNVNDFIKVI